MEYENTYIENLWDGLEIIKNQQNINHGLIKTLNIASYLIGNAEMDYYSNLSSVSELIEVPPGEYTYLKGISALKKYIKDYSLIQEKIFSATKYETDELHTLLFHYNNREFDNDLKRIGRDLKEKTDKMKEAEAKYYNKIDECISAGKECLKRNDERLQRVKEKRIEEARSLEETYLNSICEANSILNSFNEKEERVLQEENKFDIESMKTLKDIIMKYIENKKKAIAELNEKLNELENVISIISPEKDFLEFSKNNKTYKEKRKAFDFKEKQEIKQDFSGAFLNPIFHYKSPELFKEDKEKGETLHKLEIYLKEILKGNTIHVNNNDENNSKPRNENIMEEILKMLENEDNQKFFLKTLRSFKVNYNNFQKNVYDNIGKLMEKILMISLNKKNYEILNILILISPSFTLENENSVTLTNALKSPLWDNVDLWIHLIEKRVKENIMKNEANTSEGKNTLLGELVTSKINMKKYDVSKENRKKVIKHFLDEVEFDKETQDLLLEEYEIEDTNEETEGAMHNKMVEESFDVPKGINYQEEINVQQK